MSDATPETVGARVARARKRRGLTQVGLSQVTAYSRSHISQVEAGGKVATPGFVAAVADALRVDPAELWGQPYHLGHDDHVHAAIPHLRRALTAVDLGPELDGPPRTLDALAAEVATLYRLSNQAQLTKVGARLPAVIEELAHHAHETDDPATWTLLFRALFRGIELARKLGYSGDALALLGHADVVARRAGDPHLSIVAAMPRSLLLIGMGRTRTAMTLMDRMVALLDHGRGDAVELAGSLDLRTAIIATRLHDASRSWDAIGSAVERTRSARQLTNVHGLQFSVGNAAIHGAAVAVELGDADEAVRRDAAITDRTLDDLSPSRRAHHEIDMSRALVETGAYDRALGRLTAAEQLAPQMTRSHQSARNVVAHMVDLRRRLPEELRRLYVHMGA